MRPKPSRRRPAVRRVAPRVASLEQRWLMSTVSVSTQEQVVQPIPNILSTDTANQSITLGKYVQDPNVPGSIATFDTSKGPIVVALTDPYTPATVANFVGYANSGAYDNTLFHRTSNFAASAAATATAQQSNPNAAPVDVGGSPTNPADIIQGGGYNLTGNTFTHITTNAPVVDEATGEQYGNVQGTIAVANTGAGNSGTSEWFFNNTDNTANFVGATEPFTVFGHVLSGMGTVTAIASLPTTVISGLKTVPISGLTATQIAANAAISANNLVFTNGITVQAGNSYAATSSDPSLVTPVVSNGVLSFKYGTAAAGGTAIITVTGTNLYDAGVAGAPNTASESFAVTVPSTTATPAAPVTAADTADNVVSGVATAIHPLTNDTVGSGDTTALNPASVTVTTPPAHGTATVDPATGDISYTATAGYTGPDTLAYTVADVAGQVSAPTAVTVNVIPAPQSVTIGAGSKVKAVAFTQPDGARGRLTVRGGTAAVTFSAGAVATTTAGGVETVTGAGATISNVVVTNKGAAPVVAISASGKGTVTLGGLTDAGRLAQLIAPNVTLVGALAVNGMQRLVLGSANGANINITGTEGGPTVVSIPTAVNSGLADAAAVTSLTAKSWTITDGGAHVVSAAAIGKLTVTKAFADDLGVSATTGYGITTATVAAASGIWDVGASIRRATLTKPASTYALTATSVIQKLTVAGDLTGSVTGAVIEDMNVTGAMTGAVIQTNALFNAADTQLVKLTVGGAITNSVVATAGNIGTITAKSLTASRIYAGAAAATVQNDVVPSTVAQLDADAAIKSVALRAARATFASSEIAAYAITRLALGQVVTANGTTGFGVSAHTLSALSANLDPGGPLVLTKAQTKTAATLATYLSKRKKPLGQFIVAVY